MIERYWLSLWPYTSVQCLKSEADQREDSSVVSEADLKTREELLYLLLLLNSSRSFKLQYIYPETNQKKEGNGEQNVYLNTQSCASMTRPRPFPTTGRNESRRGRIRMRINTSCPEGDFSPVERVGIKKDKRMMTCPL